MFSSFKSNYLEIIAEALEEEFDEIRKRRDVKTEVANANTICYR